jgi:hypothetical protein
VDSDVVAEPASPPTFAAVLNDGPAPYNASGGHTMAIIGAHALLYTSDPNALRTMLRDAFGFRHVDAGEGWLIFALPPAELGVHPAEGPTYESGVRHQLTFMCDDIHATIHDLRSKGVNVKGEPQDEGFGITVMLGLPGGVEVMLYEPRHATALGGASR